MKKLHFVILVLNVNWLNSVIVPAIATPVCKEGELGTTTKQFPIVRTQADLRRFNGQQVTLLGRYQRVIPVSPEIKHPQEFMTEVPGGLVPIDPKINPANVPVVTRTTGFAQIVLEDGWVVPISPRGRAALRSQDELIKYDAQAVQAQGTVHWWGISDSFSTGIDIFRLNIDCRVAQSPLMSSVDSPNAAANKVSVSATDLEGKPPIGHLGYPLGKIITISGVVRQAALGAKATQRDLVLSVTAVNDRPLTQPVTIEFNVFVTAQVAKPILGRSFKYVGYETGGFTGVPPESFKFVPAVATTNHQFNTSFQILREELDLVKTKSDLIRFNDRRVQVIGRYVSKTRPAPAENTGIPGFQGTYITAQLVLEDGTEIPIFPGYDKQSLRSPTEAREHQGKIVKAVGKIKIERDLKLNPDRRSTFISIDGIWQFQPPF